MARSRGVGYLPPPLHLRRAGSRQLEQALTQSIPGKEQPTQLTTIRVMCSCAGQLGTEGLDCETLKIQR